MVDSTELDTQGSRKFRLQELVIKPARKDGGMGHAFAKQASTRLAFARPFVDWQTRAPGEQIREPARKDAQSHVAPLAKSHCVNPPIENSRA